jgi:hypothetical protein
MPKLTNLVCHPGIVFCQKQGGGPHQHGQKQVRHALWTEVVKKILTIDRFLAHMNRVLSLWQHYREELNRAPLGHETWDY